MSIRVFHADDDPSYRYLIRETLGDGEIVVVGGAGLPEEIVPGVAGTAPDVVLLDQMCPAETVDELRRAAPAARVIILTGYERDDADRALADAADAYLVKGASLDQIRAVVRG